MQTLTLNSAMCLPIFSITPYLNHRLLLFFMKIRESQQTWIWTAISLVGAKMRTWGFDKFKLKFSNEITPKTQVLPVPLFACAIKSIVVISKFYCWMNSFYLFTGSYSTYWNCFVLNWRRLLKAHLLKCLLDVLRQE